MFVALVRHANGWLGAGRFALRNGRSASGSRRGVSGNESPAAGE